MTMKLYPHQIKALEESEGLNHVAYYHDMGLGKTFVGAEKMIRLGAKINLIVCQKSKVNDWLDHFKKYYRDARAYDMTTKKSYDKSCMNGAVTNAIRQENLCNEFPYIFVINYELAFRRPQLSKLKDFTLMLDESSMIQNEKAKRSKFILNKLHPKNVILLSGTPTSGKYETLWSQLHLLGWPISNDLYWRQYIDTEIINDEGFPIKVVRGYKNVERLKSKMRDYGCQFLKTDEVFDLPEQIFTDVRVKTIGAYRKFKKDKIVYIDETGKRFVGDTVLKKMLYERMLCGSYNPHKLQAFRDLVESTEDRLIVFYNFDEELRMIEDICIDENRPLSIINGKTKDLSVYEEYPNSVTAIQYQAGAMGLNLQKANKVIYFTPPLSSELFEQSKKRIHRIGQDQTCFYYKLICLNSIEERIYKTLDMRKDYTDKLFEQGG